MKLVLFASGGSPTAGALTDGGVAPVGEYASLEQLIDRFADLRPELERRAREVTRVPLSEVQLLPPLTRPGKILCSTATQSGERPQLLFTLK